MFNKLNSLLSEIQDDVVKQLPTLSEITADGANVHHIRIILDKMTDLQEELDLYKGKEK